MKTLVIFSAIVWLAQLCTALEYVDLEPVPRYLWDESVPNPENVQILQDDAADNANLTLGDHEQMMFHSPPHG
jgi:hypothetical protein